ncbi:angiopoietin-related protein 5-like isoform X1 [Acipenser ruthenus]|uniref:angiopoietin-related protein 5-like isoform X1 n=1 Tax=Acipenser ruthenus TaxID=7906 RepID=UPI0027424160|nr:angiopoietin-related protein 5-like isoform X1 [Acipenser ruthenus]XP_058883781.1 angiopoietin-related protein 5-like isoform X1 [Acipenser ruthenus]
MGGASHLTCRVALLLCLSITASTQNQPAQGTDCTRIKALNPRAVSGVYLIQPAGASLPFQVFCDMAAEGGWTVLQRRSGTENLSFRRGWAQYRNGFGKLHGDHWLGLEKMWSLTGSQGGRFRLRVELQDFEGSSAFADYSTFRLGSERESYRLHVGAHSGNAGDAFQGTYPGIDQNGSAFSTRDRDNDGCNPCVFGDIAMMSCSELQGGSGWWFSRCGSANLNGDWHPRGDNIGWSSGVYWKSWKGPAPYSLRASVMKVKAL